MQDLKTRTHSHTGSSSVSVRPHPPALPLSWLPHPVVPVFLWPFGLQLLPQTPGHHPPQPREEVRAIQLGCGRKAREIFGWSPLATGTNRCSGDPRCQVSHCRSRQRYTRWCGPCPAVVAAQRNRRRNPEPLPSRLQPNTHSDQSRAHSHPPSTMST